jgi:hypothetical protein
MMRPALNLKSLFVVLVATEFVARGLPAAPLEMLPEGYCAFDLTASGQ